MPLYEFTCASCDALWDETRPMAESDAPAPCPDCGEKGRRSWRTATRVSVVDVSGYHPGMALRHGDPSAWVESRHSLQKLIDKRQREGFGPPIDNR